MAAEKDAGLDRMMLFSDGVFAIAITLLVLPLADAEIPDGRVGETLLELVPRMLTFALSFAVIGRFWLVHHQMFRPVERTDRTLPALNMVYLFTIAFLPFPTSVLGEHGDPAATVLYAGNLIAVATMSGLLSWYVATTRRLADRPVVVGAGRAALAGGLAPALAIVPSIPLAFLDAGWAKTSWLLILPFSMAGERLFPHPRVDGIERTF